MFFFGSLFSGIGGFDLGLERAGMKCKWQVEIDDYCLKVLAKHWPKVPKYGDIKRIRLMAESKGGRCGFRNASDFQSANRESDPLSHGSSLLEAYCKCGFWHPEAVDLICGGFPCQPWSVAGKQRGEEDDRNLWPETLRVIREMQPRYLILENVPGLIPNAYFDQILDELADADYETQSLVLPAAAFDAPHLRYRVFIVAYDANQANRGNYSRASKGQIQQLRSGPITGDVADTKRLNAGRYSEWWPSGISWWEREPAEALQLTRQGRGEKDGVTATQSQLGRVAHGIPSRVDRLRALGNAVVPQVAEWIGRRIMEHEKNKD